MQYRYGVFRLPSFESINLLDVLAEPGIVFFGEVHRVPWIIELASNILRLRYEAGRLKFVGLEYFNYRMEHLVNDWLKDRISWSEFLDEYMKGPEGFPLNEYRPILDYIKDVGLEFIGVMPPRDDARKVSIYGLDAINTLPDPPISPDEVKLDYPGYRERILEMIPKTGPMARLDREKIVMAQAYKDEVIAYKVSEAYKSFGYGVVITGYAHSEIYGSASTRARMRGVKNYIVITSRINSLPDVIKEFGRYKDLEARYIAIKI